MYPDRYLSTVNKILSEVENTHPIGKPEVSPDLLEEIKNYFTEKKKSSPSKRVKTVSIQSLEPNRQERPNPLV